MVEHKKNFTGDSRKMKRSLFDIVAYSLITLISICMLYPFLYILAMSLSSAKDLSTVTFYPKGLNFSYYNFIFHMPSVKTGYLNSLLYTGLGTIISMFLTTCCAYPLSKKWLPGRKIITIFIIITMYFSGGIIPFYIVLRRLGLYNNLASMVIPSALASIFIIIMMTFFRGISQEMEEASYVDGASEITILTKIYLPLSKPVIAVLTLFYSVGQWNSWFFASILLKDKVRFPIQLILRNVMRPLGSGGASGTGVDSSELAQVMHATGLLNIDGYALNYALSIAIILPIVIIFPFVQKYFVKGVMIGSLKG